MSETALHLLVGLGNPGTEYAQTRHNIGFLCLDHLADRFQVSFSGSRWQAEVGRSRLWGGEAVFVKPLTYMNRSGLPVSQAARYYRLPHNRIIVVHDDVDLEWGRMKIVANRGAGGHNGIRSIIEQLGDKDFVRVRIGIGRPVKTETPMASFVLARFSEEERARLPEVFSRFEEAVQLVFEHGLPAAMKAVNSGP